MSDLGASGTLTNSDDEIRVDQEIIPIEEKHTELAILGEAIEAAKKAFEDLLHKYVIDTRCYRFSAKVEFRDVTFTKNLAKYIYEDLS